MKKLITIDDRLNKRIYQMLQDEAIKKYNIKIQKDFIEILISPKNKGLFVIGTKGQILEQQTI